MQDIYIHKQRWILNSNLRLLQEMIYFKKHFLLHNKRDMIPHPPHLYFRNSS